MDALAISPPHATPTHSLLCVEDVLAHVSSSVLCSAQGRGGHNEMGRPEVDLIVAALTVVRDHPFLYLPLQLARQSPDSDAGGACDHTGNGPLAAWAALLEAARGGGEGMVDVYWARWDAKKGRFFYVNLADPSKKTWTLGVRADSASGHQGENTMGPLATIPATTASSTTTYPTTSAVMSPTTAGGSQTTFPQGVPRPAPVVLGGSAAACAVAEGTQRLRIAVENVLGRLHLMGPLADDRNLRYAQMTRRCVVDEAHVRQEVSFEASLEFALLMDGAREDRRGHVATAEARRQQLEELAVLLEASQYMEQSDRLDVRATEAHQFDTLMHRIHATLALYACPAVRDIAESLVALKVESCELHLEQAAVYQDAMRSIAWGRPCVAFDGQAAKVWAMRGDASAAAALATTAYRKDLWRREGRLLETAYAAMEQQHAVLADLTSRTPTNAAVTPYKQIIVRPESPTTEARSAVGNEFGSKRGLKTSGSVVSMMDATELCSPPSSRRPPSSHRRRSHRRPSPHTQQQEATTFAANYYWCSPALSESSDRGSLGKHVAALSGNPVGNYHPPHECDSNSAPATRRMYMRQADDEDAETVASAPPSWYPSSTTLPSPPRCNGGSSRSTSATSAGGTRGGRAPQPNAAPPPLPVPLVTPRHDADAVPPRFTSDPLRVRCSAASPTTALMMSAPLSARPSVPHRDATITNADVTIAAHRWAFARCVGVLLSEDLVSATCRMWRHSSAPAMPGFALSEPIRAGESNQVNRMSLRLCTAGRWSHESAVAVGAAPLTRVFFLFVGPSEGDGAAAVDDGHHHRFSPNRASPPRSSSALLQAVAMGATRSDVVHAAVVCDVRTNRRQLLVVKSGSGGGATTDVAVQTAHLPGDNLRGTTQKDGLLTPEAFTERWATVAAAARSPGVEGTTATLLPYVTDGCCPIERVGDRPEPQTEEEGGICDVSMVWRIRRDAATTGTPRPVVDALIALAMPTGGGVHPTHSTYTATVPLDDMDAPRGSVWGLRVAVQFGDTAHYSIADLHD